MDLCHLFLSFGSTGLNDYGYYGIHYDTVVEPTTELNCFCAFTPKAKAQKWTHAVNEKTWIYAHFLSESRMQRGWFERRDANNPFNVDFTWFYSRKRCKFVIHSSGNIGTFPWISLDAESLEKREKFTSPSNAGRIFALLLRAMQLYKSWNWIFWIILLESIENICVNRTIFC